MTGVFEEIELRGTSDLEHQSERSGQKNERGSDLSPFPAKPHFTPSRKNLGHHHPGKIKNHLPSASATALPRVVNTYAKPQTIDSKSFVRNMHHFGTIHTENIYSFSQ